MAAIEQRIYNGDRAKEVLENEAFLWAFEAIEQELTEAWKSSPARDEAGREKLFLMQQMLQKVELALKNMLETGTLAKKELQYQQNLADRAKESLRSFVR